MFLACCEAGFKFPSKLGSCLLLPSFHIKRLFSGTV